MSLPKQLINLIGVVVVLAVVVIGVVVVALPLYTQSLATDGETVHVAQTNSVYDIQVQGLQAAKKKLPQTQQEVAQLRTQISVPNHLDDVFEIAIKAATATKSTITAMTAAEVEPFVARTTVGDDGKAAAPKPTPVATPAPAATDKSSSDAAATDGAAAAAPPATSTADGRSEAPFSIKVDVPSPAAAAQFLDDLRKGPRLIAITHSTLTGTPASGDTDGSYTLTVDALAFIHTAD
ncbi:hypothetical protein GH740_12875 [Microbacterium sp. SYP-A9085]|uniref:hypothetical protein n=1 Tax=Microbacterium sp. SYP-A9085 TaxID=2664454 RepID=UPI00129B6648|nr:hypothetical protein [Microbacterium sp. SYP-A9085]MRH30193.1 hypothetical protein [Microbacterium sp. SYP-A9085]